MNNYPLLSDVMVSDVIAVDVADDLRIVSRVFNNFDYDFVPVVKNNKLIGIIQRKDYQNISNQLTHRASRQGEAVLANVQARAIMTNNMIKLATHNSVAAAIEIFQTGLFPTIPVVNRSNELVGIVTCSDMLNNITDDASPTGSAR